MYSSTYICVFIIIYFLHIFVVVSTLAHLYFSFIFRFCLRRAHVKLFSVQNESIRCGSACQTDHTELHSLSAKERLNQNLLLTPNANKRRSRSQAAASVVVAAADIVTSLKENSLKKCIVLHKPGIY